MTEWDAAEKQSKRVAAALRTRLAQRATHLAQRRVVNSFNKTERGALYERMAQDYLVRQGLTDIAQNVRAGGVELDLIMRASDGTVVFVEVRARQSALFGGAAASVDWAKRRRLLRGASAWLLRWRGPTPPCRFDVVAIEQGEVVWIQNAFGEYD